MSWQDKIRNEDCEECPLHEGAEYVCLMGSGSRKAKVMLIGEAPGAREDETHRAFVGPSGKLLTKLLKEAGLKRSDCYITNIAKCRPPRGVTPKRTEIKTCTGLYLHDEIERVSPEIIVVLGNSALQGILGRSGIKKHRGSTTILGDAMVLATFHPAAALRNPYLEPELQADFRRLGRLVRGEKDKLPTKVRIIHRGTQLKALIKLLMKQPEIAFDLETFTFDNGVRLKGKPVVSALQEWRDDQSVIACISFSWAPGESAVIPLWHEKSKWKDPGKVLRMLKPVLEREDCKYIAHNGKFDCRWLAANKVFMNLTFDTMIAAHMLDENRSKGLKPLSQVILGVDAYDIGEDVKDAYHTPLKRLCVYAAKDADYTLRLYRVFREQLKERPRTARIFKLMMMPSSNVLTKVERRGIWVDHERLDERLQRAKKKLDRIRRFMLTHVPPHKQPQSVPAGATKKLTKELGGINFNSNPQVAEWLFEDLELPILELTEGEAPSTAESVMLQLASQHVACKALLKYRKWAKYLSTYLYPLKYVHRDDRSRIHPTFKLFGTVTGRLSCSDPNLQNIPRDPFLRSLIGAPSGWMLIEADYAQIELRVAAMLADETNMLRAFHQGRDIHMEMAMDLIGKPESEVSSEQRKLAKSVNFGFLYSMGWETFIIYARDKYEIDISEEEAIKARAKFFRKWPKFQNWHERQRRVVQRYNYVQSPIGRVRHLPDVQSRDLAVRHEAERQAINSPVQSFASDLMLMSALRLDAILHPKFCFTVGSIHDALLFQVKKDWVDHAAETIKSVMLNPPLKPWFGMELTVPIEVEIKTGRYWGAKENKIWVPS